MPVCWGVLAAVVAVGEDVGEGVGVFVVVLVGVGVAVLKR